MTRAAEKAHIIRHLDKGVLNANIKLLLKILSGKSSAPLTVFGITIAILAFGLLRTVVSAWYNGLKPPATRLITRNSISIIFFLPLSYKEKIRQIPSVKNISYSCWFGGIYISEKNFIPNFAVDAKTVLNSGLNLC